MMDLEKSLVMSVNDNEEGIKDIVIQCQFLKGNLTFMFYMMFETFCRTFGAGYCKK